MEKKGARQTEDSSGVHLWLVLMKAFQALAGHAEGSIKRTELGDSDFRVLEALLHKGPLPVNTVGPKVWLTPGSIGWSRKGWFRGRARPRTAGCARLN
jgi:MarR family transcriptional regulator, 2-MHQ and catechol-resistance regulon repressor